MLARFQFTAAIAGLALGLASTAFAQTETTIAPEDSFSLESAILDTSIPFALGAHEARQELRGAFGWPTFQEGLIQGVYFRFDPDGYARFSPNARLDTDVFEVICRPRTHVCMGRKGAMSLTLSASGQLELKLENIAEGDSFSIAEGVSELQLPSEILQPLDQRLELLLSTGGDLVIRRGQNEVDRVSLRGFGPVSAYLRWVSARQDYSVLPRDWPIPNDGTAPRPTQLTQAASWPTTAQQSAPLIQATPAQAGAPANTEVAEVRGELRVLRELLLDRGQGGTAQPAMQAAAQPEGEIQELQQALDMLSQEIARLQNPNMAAPPNMAVQPQVGLAPVQPSSLTTPAQQLPLAQGAMTGHSMHSMTPKDPATTDAHRMATQLEYLMTEIGLAPDVALMLVQQQAQAATPSAVQTAAPAMAGGGQPDVIDDILAELRGHMPATEAPAAMATPAVAPDEYQLLSDYFQSVFAKP